MTPQESQLLNDLVRRVRETKLAEKDLEAEALLFEGLKDQPNALYILAQTVLVQDIALQQTHAQVEQLKQQLQATQQQAPQPAKATSFLGGLLGRHERPQAPPPPPPPSGQQPYQQQAPPQYAQPQYQGAPVPPAGYPAAYPPPQPAGGGSSFLRSAATTAAGVAAGALAFQGIESLFHGIGHSGGMYGGGFGVPSGFGGMGGSFLGGAPAQETIINNYYDDNGPSERNHHEQEANFDERPSAEHHMDHKDYNDSDHAPVDNADYRYASDASQNTGDGRYDDTQNYTDDTDSNNDSGNSGLFGSVDDSNFDDGSSLDDDGLFDDGGSDDSGF